MIVSVRRCLVACVALSVLASRPAAAQSESSSVAGASPSNPGLVVAEPNGANAPLLRSVVSLDLRNVPLRDALRQISAHMGGRLMYDESVTSLKHRVTLRDDEISLGRALRQLLAGTDVEVFVSQGAQGGQLVLLKRVAPPPPVDSVTVRGVVTDSASGAPIGRVMVYLDGTRRRSMTNDAGVFVFTRVPVGEHELMVRRLGFAQWRRTITVAVGDATEIQIRLAPTATMLDDVVTTGSGERARKEVGTSIAVIDAEAEVNKKAYQDLSDLLEGRANGLTSIPGGGSVNSQSRQRIRGLNSINASNDPIMIIDGIRAASGYPSCRQNNVDGCENIPSRFDDIDVNDIESIEILKGPSASALWGSDASNGVIVIKTKRGRAGPTRWTAHYEEGFTQAPTDFRVPMQGLGTAANGTSVGPCSLIDQAAGKCVAIDSVAGGFNRYDNPRTTSMALGRSSDAGISAAGGNEQIQYYLSGGYRVDVGTAKMPDIDQKIVRQALGQALPQWMVRPDEKTNSNLLGRITGQFSPTADYAISTNFIQIRSGTGQDGVMGATSDLRSAADTFDLSNGWDQFYLQRKYQTTRFIGSVQGNWRPVSWFSGHATLGRDYAYEDGGEFGRRNWCLPFCSTTSRQASGTVDYGETRTMVQTVDLRGNFNAPLRHGLRFRTDFGAQHTRERKHDFEGSASNIPVGRTDFNSAPADDRSVFESSDDKATLGMYVAPSISLNDRLFVSAALRRDISSTLGSDVAPVYPKWDISWIASEEPFMAPWRARGLSSLRLRTAFGQAGVQPGSTAKLRTYSQLARFVSPGGIFGANYAILSGVGNDELRPERSSELEGGFELGLWNDRLFVDFTAFRKMTKDAIVDRKLAPSLGLSVTSSQFYNVGNVKNSGIEAKVNARFIDRPDLQLSLQVAFSKATNKLVSLGAGVEPFSITASNINPATVKDDDGIVMPGYPLFGRWARPIAGFSDANGDGIITPNEVRLADSLVFLGGSLPEAEMAFTPQLGFWDNRISIEGQLSYVHGLTQRNEYGATTRFFTAAAFDPDTPLEAQACIIAASSPHVDDFCFYETVNVLRLNQFSVAFTPPTRFAELLRAQSATFYIVGSNLGVWSSYNGIDPLANTADAAGNRFVGGAAVPKGKIWTVRARLTF
jgi:TonB-linked SusC/RagA family outer membrane protein